MLMRLLSLMAAVSFLSGAVHGQGGIDLLHLSHVHRGGGRLERPDNTLETFTWCWENGSALECDCRKTKDGVGSYLKELNPSAADFKAIRARMRRVLDRLPERDVLRHSQAEGGV